MAHVSAIYCIHSIKTTGRIPRHYKDLDCAVYENLLNFLRIILRVHYSAIKD